MEPNAQRGKVYILVLFASAVLVSSTIIITYNATIGQQNLGPQLTRLFVKVILMLATYAGFRTAKWVLCALYVFEATTAYLNLISGDTKGEVYLSGFLGVFHIVVPVAILFSKSISAFLEHQKMKA